jgi:acyl carrier protein
MTRAELLTKIRDMLADIVDEPDLTITESTVAEDVAEWDSVNHVKLIIALEADVKVRFEPDEISSPQDVGGLIDLIEQKIAGR